MVRSQTRDLHYHFKAENIEAQEQCITRWHRRPKTRLGFQSRDSMCCGPLLPTTLPDRKSRHSKIYTGWTTDKSKTNRLGMHTSSKNQEAEAGAWIVWSQDELHDKGRKGGREEKNEENLVTPDLVQTNQRCLLHERFMFAWSKVSGHLGTGSSHLFLGTKRG